MLDYLKEALDKFQRKQVNPMEVREAKEILDKPLIQEFFAQYREHLKSLWCNSRDIEEREELHRLYQTSDKFEQHFKSYIMHQKLEKLNK